MNRKQKIVIGVGVAIILIMGLFPPWVSVFHRGAVHYEEAAGYSLIFTCRLPVNVEWIAKLRDLTQQEARISVQYGHSTDPRDNQRMVDELDRLRVKRMEIMAEYEHRASEAARGHTLCLDLTRLLIQWATIIMVVAGLVFILKERDRR